MGKSFTDDVFNNDFDVANINGLNISQEAIEENKQEKKTNIDLKELGIDNVDELKKQYEKEQEKKKPTATELKKDIIQQQEKQEQQAKLEEQQDKEQKEPTVKQTMIFKQEHLDIIKGLANINDMQIKDVLSQLLDKSINEIKEKDPKIIDKALKNSKKKEKTEKSIF